MAAMARPGDWVCALCSNMNFANRMVCNRCNTPRQGPSMSPHLAQMGPGYGKASYGAPAQRAAPYPGQSKGPGAGGGSALSKTASGATMKPGDWCCPQCFNHNFADKVACNKCGVPKNPMMHGQAGVAFGGKNPMMNGMMGMATNTGPVRPGDWVCHACKNNNYASRDACNRCQMPKSTFISKSGLRPGDWLCPNCQNHNYADKAFCLKCQTPKSAESVHKSSDKSGGDWVCHACKNVNYANREVCNRCQIPKSTFISKTGLRPGDWLCPACQNHNFADKVACAKCKTPKSLESVSTTGMKPGDWLCTFCSNHNFADKVRCNKCQRNKQVSAVTLQA